MSVEDSHRMVRSVSSTGALTNLLTAQLFMTDAFVNSAYTANSAYTTRGNRDTTDATDRVYNTTTSSGATAEPLLTINPVANSSGTGYTGATSD